MIVAELVVMLQEYKPDEEVYICSENGYNSPLNYLYLIHSKDKSYLLLDSESSIGRSTK